MTAVTLDAVRVARGGRTVLDASVAIAPARLTVVVGPNGAGKSTLLEATAGLLRADAGTVAWDGTPVDRLSRRERARRRAYLPQRARVDWPISVERVVALGLTPILPAFGDLSSGARAQVTAALAEFDLTGLADRPATALSGGELARAMLARATVGTPGLLIVDEPTAGLDPAHAVDAARRLRARADAGATVIVALHDLELALAIADDAVALAGGRVVAAGAAGAVLTGAVLSKLYGTPVQVARDGAGASVRLYG